MYFVFFHCEYSEIRPQIFLYLQIRAVFGVPGSERYFAACATTHIPQAQLDRVLLCECDHRPDELTGLEVGVSGEFITEFELVSVQEP